jgi:hypothetical protein
MRFAGISSTPEVRHTDGGITGDVSGWASRVAGDGEALFFTVVWRRGRGSLPDR